MEISISQLRKLPIKKLKVIIDKLEKEPKSMSVWMKIKLIQKIIDQKKGRPILFTPCHLH